MYQKKKWKDERRHLKWGWNHSTSPVVTKHNDDVISTVYLCGLGDHQSWLGF